MTDKEKNKTCGLGQADTATFRCLVSWWAESLGRHQIPMHDRPADINGLLTPDAVHHELIQAVVRKVYCANNCGHLDAAVTMEDTFTALGRMRVELLGSPRADIDQIDLLDSIGWHTRQYFGHKAESSGQAVTGGTGGRAGNITVMRGIGA